jgi:phenylpyruvate tautomerase PptA (4-oxalocrotonate tautomerase family)
MAKTTPIELTRHYAELSEQETEELIEAVAMLVVEFIKQKGISCRPLEGAQILIQEVHA